MSRRRPLRLSSGRLLQQTGHGTEEQRVQGLPEARSIGLYLPDSTLNAWFETHAPKRGS